MTSFSPVDVRPMNRFWQFVRYTTVSVISSAVSMSVLGVLVFTGLTAAGWANVISTVAGTIPSFELNRRWVWGKTGPLSLLVEVGPFVALTAAGLVLSTVAVSVVAGWATRAGLSPAMRTLWVEAANAAAFGSLWLLQFVVFDRLSFRTVPPASAEAVLEVV